MSIDGESCAEVVSGPILAAEALALDQAPVASVCYKNIARIALLAIDGSPGQP
jgi:hypothetical protein